MKKIKTTRRFKGELSFFLLATVLVSGMALSHAGKITGLGGFGKAKQICTVIIVSVSFISALSWAVRNRIDRGFLYAWRNYMLTYRLRQQLLEAGVYTIKKFGDTKLARIPPITVDFEPDFQIGSLYITNSINFHDKLGRLDISPALGRYAVEQVYLTDDKNRYRFDFYDALLERRLLFDDFNAFKEYSRRLNPYTLFIDIYTELTLTHQLLVGQTGSGKTYALHGYLLQMLLKPIKYYLYFADPKSSSIALLGEQVSPQTTAEDFEGIVSLLETFVSEMHERQLQIKKRLSGKIDGDYRDFGMCPHILIFDEYADFSLFLQTMEKKLRDHVNSLISQIVLKGRQSGFFLWIVMQQAGSNNIPTYIRDNLPWKVVLGNAEDQTYTTAFGAGTDIPAREMEDGDGVYTYPTIANKPRLCSFPTLEFDILGALEAGVM